MVLSMTLHRFRNFARHRALALHERGERVIADKILTKCRNSDEVSDRSKAKAMTETTDEIVKLLDDCRALFQAHQQHHLGDEEVFEAFPGLIDRIDNAIGTDQA